MYLSLRLLLFCIFFHFGSSWSQPRQTSTCQRSQLVCSGNVGEEISESLKMISMSLGAISETLKQFAPPTSPTSTEPSTSPTTTESSMSPMTTESSTSSTTTESSTSPITTEPPTLPITTEPPEPKGTLENPANSCSDIPQSSPSGNYWVLSNTTGSSMQVYCDTARNCCGSTGSWMRVAHLDMTDPNQQCPSGFYTYTYNSLRFCQRPIPSTRPDDDRGCVSVTYSSHGIEYSHVCGKIKAYQRANTGAFYNYNLGRELTIDDQYVCGVSLTHGQSPRQHIWTFAAASTDAITNTLTRCPCTNPDSQSYAPPSFVGQDYFCDSGYDDYDGGYLLSNSVSDPLWDGQGCSGTSTCCEFNNPPWFCKQLPQPTTDDIELRICTDYYVNGQNTPIEKVDIFVQ